MHEHEHNCLHFHDLPEEVRDKVLSCIDDGTVTVIKLVDDLGNSKETLMITEYMEEFGLKGRDTIHFNEVSDIVKKLMNKLDEEKMSVLKEIREGK